MSIFSRKQHAPAFTLLELIVACSIIALLIAILGPSLALASRSARRLRCVANLRAVGNSLNLYKSNTGRYPQINGPPRVGGLANIGDVADLLVRDSLGDPRALFCPASVEDDPYAHPAWYYVNDSGTKKIVQFWRLGETSFMYLCGVTDEFRDASDRPTFNAAAESPDVPRNNRAVLIGDRTVEFGPKGKNIPGSNHGKQGGWFYYVAGDMHWRNWSVLTAHPTSPYIWYWPRTTRFPSVNAGN